jgi:beta-lactamase class A
MLYATRLLILSIGVGVLSGTVLSIWDPANRSLTSQQPVKQAGVTSSGSQEAGDASPAQLAKVGQELTTLKSAMQALITKNPQMTPGVFVMDLDTNAYVDLNGSASFSSASTIKVPILIAFFQDVDEGKIRLDEQLVLRKELIGGGSGDMQYDAPGTKYTALDVATRMITISDNTATNLLIARLGGIRSLNQRFKSWGLNATVLNNLLPDLEGTNTTTPKELALLLGRISQGELVTMRSRDRLLDIMRRTENHSQLRQGLGNGAIIAHKTGDIGSLIGDTGLVDLPNGKRYVITVMVKRAHNDDRAYDYVGQLSRLAYLYFSRSTGNPKVTASPAPPSTQPSSGTSSETPPSSGNPSESSGEESNSTGESQPTTL